MTSHELEDQEYEAVREALHVGFVQMDAYGKAYKCTPHQIMKLLQNAKSDCELAISNEEIRGVLNGSSDIWNDIKSLHEKNTTLERWVKRLAFFAVGLLIGWYGPRLFALSDADIDPPTKPTVTRLV